MATKSGHFNIFSILKEKCDSRPEFSFVRFLRPIFRVGRFFCLIPFYLDKEGKKVHILGKNSFWYWYRFIPFSITIVCTIFQLVSFIISVARKHSFVELMSQSLWLNGALISLVTCLLCTCMPFFKERL